MELAEYLSSIRRAATTIFEGMAVTFSHLFREPITIQYPDRLERPMTEMLPMRYRGLLEVQMDICTGCKRCEKACPIDCIAIDLDKREVPGATKKETGMSRFDIDMGKCMYCGLCVEACVAESTGAIRHTREFEAASSTLDGLCFRFILTGDFHTLYKPPKDKTLIPVGEYGPHAREARERALRDNHEALTKLRDTWYVARDGKLAQKKTEAAAKKRSSFPDARRVAEIVTAVDLVRPDDPPTWTAVVGSPGPTVGERFARLLESFTPQTDCGKCHVPTCIDYARALASGKDADPTRCTPGGTEVTSDLDVAVARWFRRDPVTPEGGAKPPPVPETAPAAAPAAAPDPPPSAPPTGEESPK